MQFVHPSSQKTQCKSNILQIWIVDLTEETNLLSKCPEKNKQKTVGGHTYLSLQDFIVFKIR